MVLTISRSLFHYLHNRNISNCCSPPEQKSQLCKKTQTKPPGDIFQQSLQKLSSWLRCPAGDLLPYSPQKVVCSERLESSCPGAGWMQLQAGGDGAVPWGTCLPPCPHPVGSVCSAPPGSFGSAHCCDPCWRMEAPGKPPCSACQREQCTSSASFRPAGSPLPWFSLSSLAVCSLSV